MTSFIPQGDHVIWTGSKPVPLSLTACEAILNVFIDADAREAYFDLHDAYVAAGGIPLGSAGFRRAA